MSGEGCFFINIFKSLAYKWGFAVRLRFALTQHTRDEEFLKSLVDYLDCGCYQLWQGKNWGNFIVTKFSDITDKIIPFFDKYHILGVKSQDYVDFKRVVVLMKTKGHLTTEGLEQIKQIKSGMNRGRSSYQPL